MSISLAIVVAPSIAGVEFVTAVKGLLGIDLPPSTTAKGYLSALAALTGRQSDPVNMGIFLRQLSYTVAVGTDAPTALAIREGTCLHAVPSTPVDGDSILLLAGSLLDFRTEVINGCSASVSRQFREYSTALLVRLDQAGLAFVFESYTRRSDSSGTLILSPRRP